MTVLYSILLVVTTAVEMAWAYQPLTIAFGLCVWGVLSLAVLAIAIRFYRNVMS